MKRPKQLACCLLFLYGSNLTWFFRPIEPKAEPRSPEFRVNVDLRPEPFLPLWIPGFRDVI